MSELPHDLLYGAFAERIDGDPLLRFMTAEQKLLALQACLDVTLDDELQRIRRELDEDGAA